MFQSTVSDTRSASTATMTASSPAAVSPEAAGAGGGRIGAITAVAALSGFAGLGYEIVWARMLAVALGHEIVAVLGVVSALFAGLALGSLLLGRRIASSPKPAAWYAGLECMIGLWALALIILSPLAAEQAPALVPVDAGPLRQWIVAFGLPFVLLLPATLAMGATLPALEAVLAPLLATRDAATHGAVGRVYAANTAGAVAGTLGTAFLLIPVLGLSATLMACAGLNFACAALLIACAGEGRAALGTAAASLRNGTEHARSLLAALFITGLLGIGYEVVTVRVLSQILENTIYTFAILLAAYLTGTALGAVARNAVAARRPGADLTRALVVATALACLLGAALLGVSDTMLEMLRAALPATFEGRLAAELGIAALAFLPPTIAMGALFTELAQRASDKAGGVGPALAVNTLGAALAPILFGPLLLPVLGAKLAFVLIAIGYLLVLPDLGRRSLMAAGLVGAATAALAVAPLSLRFVRIPPGGELVWHRDGVMAAVSVIANSAGDRHLQVNNHFRMGGSASMRSDHRQAHIPLLLHPAPESALFLGLGTGATLSAAGAHPGLRADGVELVPEVVETFPLFGASAGEIGRNPRLRVHVADARRFVRAPGSRYDVIVADLYHPSVDGSGALYAREHFAAIRDRLAEGGLFAQWLPLHQLDLPTLRIIVRTFLDTFPDASAYLAQFSVETPLIALIGRREPKTYPADWAARRIKDPALAGRLAALDMTGNFSLFGLYLAGRPELAAFAGPGPVNTDDRPLVTTDAPRIAYAGTDTPADRLVALLAALHPMPEEVLDTADPDARRRLAAYWRARDAYLETGAQTLAARGPRDVIGTLAPRLIEIVRMSPDFEPAYAPVLAMARQRAVSEPAAARRLLEALDRANPARPDARRLLAALPPDAASAPRPQQPR
ncbi:fused MFS/spermidine synthase [Xanthobacter oligotrophicus]|uniref:fused MFS/spermidine synthase n=1 Tax=Xanthobacter oligotrophicus TaxID=2607286 RepID=UPI001E2E7C12|nr:fused MFS/spermidine synthase [Xanthobacter oligotrophicus]MCG5234865.1 fused MFS/spermidine synthase [Xanthobacter oligotrophicus]